MSWLYSRALVGEFLGESSRDGAQYVQLNETPMPQAFSSLDRMTEFSRLSRYGMTFAPLTEPLGGDVLTSYLEVFHARTSVLQEEEPVSKESAVGCGSKWHESSMKYAPDTSSWKTRTSSSEEDLPWSSVILPRWGMTRRGVVFQQTPLGQTTRESVCGSLLPTPTCHNAKEGAYPAEYRRRTPTLATHVGGKIHPHFTEWMMGWPQGWTDLLPLETDRFQSWRQVHSPGFATS